MSSDISGRSAKYRKLHKDEIDIDKLIVRKLINEQFSQFSNLPVREVRLTGTVNAIYRLGEEYYIRLPRLDWANDALHNEFKVLPVISRNVTLRVPEIVEKGKPNADYPFDWTVSRWIQGDIYRDTLVNEAEAAEELAQFIIELHSIQVTGDAPKAGRKPLRELDEETVKAITECQGDIDVENALKVWHELIEAEPWDFNPVWIHADLLKPNLIVNGGKLSAIIDFGSAGVGDPAFDIIPAWTVLTSEARGLFKRVLNLSDDIWQRARAYALHQAVFIIPYYRESNPKFVEQAKKTINNLL